MVEHDMLVSKAAKYCGILDYDITCRLQISLIVWITFLMYLQTVFLL